MNENHLLEPLVETEDERGVDVVESWKHPDPSVRLAILEGYLGGLDVEEIAKNYGVCAVDCEKLLASLPHAGDRDTAQRIERMEELVQERKYRLARLANEIMGEQEAASGDASRAAQSSRRSLKY